MRRLTAVLISFAMTAPARATIALVSAAHVGAGSTDTNGFTTSAIDTSGSNFLVAAVGFFSAITLTDSKSNTWVPLNTATNSTGNNSIRIYYSVNPTVGSGHTFTLAGAGTFGAISVQGFSGVSGSPFDQQNTANTIAATLQPGNVTPTQDNELIVTSYSESSAVGTLAIDSGFTITDQTPVLGGGHFGSALAYIIKGASTSGVGVNPTWTNLTGSDQSAASIATFKVTAGAAASFGTINNPVGSF